MESNGSPLPIRTYKISGGPPLHLSWIQVSVYIQCCRTNCIHDYYNQHTISDLDICDFCILKLSICWKRHLYMNIPLLQSNPTMGAHVLIFPLPLQGPINSMLKLAELLCLRQIKVTFIITQHIHLRLFHSSDAQAYSTKYGDAFRFNPIPDGLPKDHPRTVFEFSELMTSLGATAPPVLHQMLISTDDHSPTCVVADGLLTFATDIAAQARVPLLYFDTISPSAIWTYMCLPKLIQAGDLPFKGLSNTISISLSLEN